MPFTVQFYGPSSGWLRRSKCHLLCNSTGLHVFGSGEVSAICCAIQQAFKWLAAEKCHLLCNSTSLQVVGSGEVLAMYHAIQQGFKWLAAGK